MINTYFILVFLISMHISGSRRLSRQTSLTQTPMDTHIHAAFSVLRREPILDIFIGTDAEQCIDLLETTGIVQLVYEELNKLQVPDDVYQGMSDSAMLQEITRHGTQLCRAEATQLKASLNKYNSYPEHLQNEIQDMLLQTGKEKEAWIAPTLSQCIQLMQSEIETLSEHLHQQFPLIRNMKYLNKLLQFFIFETCESYFYDKRDL
mmetsp:Transcript_34107/g.55603  ORF Transcript_34107/g.55603 Transcript_34107/m.55603 type:complete len:206 (+) Transcript_34107:43-660(+)